ncbi:MAG: GNAT family N-acetyltransferase [Clostridia bacterium]|nr:GNAT family N-acetyltransferase [Clostridia bacterium]
MIEIREIELTEDRVQQLIALSQMWVDENISNGMVTNSREDIKEPIFAALEGEKIVGYAFGHAYVKEKKTDSVPVGSRCFDVDELYVLPAYRSQGIGGRLFQAVEAYAKTQGDFLTLATSTKDYKRVLHFYAEQNGMDFHDAYLTKKL